MVTKNMKLKTLTMSAAIAATVVTSAAVASQPANAFVLNFAGDARLKNSSVKVGKFSQLDFAKFDRGNTLGTGTATVLDSTSVAKKGSTITLQDLSLKKTSATTWSLVSIVPNFITGLNSGVAFTLDTFNLTKGIVGKSTIFSADYTGTFTGLGNGTGSLTTSGSGDFTSADGTSYSSGIRGTSIPTPALLPGLLGFGAAALRKRKGEAVTEAEAEAVEV